MRSRRRRTHAEGQALVLGALVLTVMFAMLLTAVELSYRRLQRIRLDDALAQAARSTVQSFTYQSFADGDLTLRSPAEVEAQARALFLANLANVSSMDVTAEDMADLVQWTVLPAGGTCTVRGETLTFTTPALCAELEAPLRGLFWPTFTPRVGAAETIDRLE